LRIIKKMETTIFYFAATGNSLSPTRKIAQEIDNCKPLHSFIQCCSELSIKHPNFDATLKQHRDPSVNIKGFQNN